MLPTSTPRYREKNSSSHRKNSSLSSALTLVQSIPSRPSSLLLFPGGYPLGTRVGGEGSLNGADGCSGRVARGAVGGVELGGVVRVRRFSNCDLNTDGGGGSSLSTAPPLVLEERTGGSPCVDDGGGARFQLGSQLAFEEEMLEYRSLVFTTLLTPASFTFSAFALSSATGHCEHIVRQRIVTHN